MKVRWIGEPRALADPQVEVGTGDEIDVDDDVGKSLIEQGLAESAEAKATAKKEKA